MGASRLEKQQNIKIAVTLVESSISAGFPSPADEYMEQALDLNKFLIEHPSATFMAWVSGDSMIGAGIFNKDLLIIDRSLEPRHNSIVLAHLNGEFTLKRLIKTGKRVFLCPENSKYKPVEVLEDMEFKIWGVLRHSIRMGFVRGK